MEDLGISWPALRLAIACIVGGMGAASLSKPNPTDEEKKAMGWVFVILAIAVYLFIKVVITLGALLAALIIVWKVGPLVLQALHGAKTDIGREVAVWQGVRNNLPALTHNRLLEEIEEALEEGVPSAEIQEHIRRRKNGNQSRNGQ